MTSLVSEKAKHVAGQVKPRAAAFGRWAGPHLQSGWQRFLAWWSPLSGLRKLLVILVLGIPFAYLVFGKSKEAPFELKVQREGAVPYDIYIIDAVSAGNNPSESLRLEHASILRPFGLVIRFYNLVPGRAYQILCELEDNDGKKIPFDGQRNLQPDSPSGWAYFPFTPDYQTYEAGKWKARFNVSEVGVIPFEFEVKAPSKEEKEQLADHEEAEKLAVRAFANYWVVSAHQGVKTYVAGSQQFTDQTDVFKKFILYQVAGVDYKMTQGYISPADRLNGIAYRGAAGFGFTLYRIYYPDQGWTEWRDVDRPGNPLSGGFASMRGATNIDPASQPDAGGMRFEIEKRDGHWYAKSPEGLLLVDGSVKGTGNPIFLDAKISDKSLLKGNLFVPDIGVVSKISEEGITLRGNLLKLAKEVEASPEVLLQQQGLTIKSLE